MNSTSLQIPLADEAATLTLGAAIAPHFLPGMFITLTGDLGAGKTTLTRGVLRGLGYTGRVKSPTYTLVELYVFSRLNLYHFDFYRLLDRDKLFIMRRNVCINNKNLAMPLYKLVMEII